MLYIYQLVQKKFQILQKCIKSSIEMNRKIKTSNSRRPFLHQQQNQSQFQTESNIIRPPTSHPYSNLYNFRSTAKIKNQYQSNYFATKFINERKVSENVEKEQHKLKSKIPHVAEDEDLPKGFRILVTQIKVLLKNALCEEEQIKEVTKGFTKKIKELVKENDEMKAKMDEYVKEISEQKQNIQKLTLKIKQLNQVKPHQHQKQYAILTQSKKPPTQFQLMLQNLHLTQLNTSYLNTIKQLKALVGEQKVEIKKQIRDSDASTDLLRYHNRINYLEMKVSNCENIQNQLTTKNQVLEGRVQELNEDITKLREQLRYMQEQRNQWRQRALMQKEDSETNVSRQNFLLFSIKKLRQINKNLTDKLLNITTEDGAKKLKELEPNPYFQYQVDFFKSIKSVYYQAKLKEYKLSLQNKKDAFELQPMGLQQEYIDYRKHQQVNLSIMNYFRPTFFSFIQECATNDIYTCRVKGSTSISRIFIQVLRAILNCKINEFFLSNGEQKYTRFPQFVYSWFEKFYFNSERSQICALQPFMQKPISQDVFYRDLMNVKLDQSWEIITFREFLLQQLSLEELYFYLMCQNLLYKKAGINEEIQYLGEFCIFVEFSAAKSVLDLVLSDFQSWNISFLTSKLRQKIIIKKNVQFIESGFFLRCLIEYYKIQRINRYKYISKLCDEFKSCEQNGLRFSSFISVINRFTEISSQQKIRLYRDCYSVGRGKITADVIFTVCTEELVFLRYLKLKCFYKLPTMISYKELRRNKKKQAEEDEKLQLPKKQLICVQPSDSYIYEIFIGLNRLLTNEKSFNRRIHKLGVSEILSHFDSIRKLFGQKSTNNDSSLLRCKHFIHYISATMQKIREISFQNFYDLLEENNKKKTDGSFWIEISENQLCDIFVQEFKCTFEVFDKINAYRLWKEQVYHFRVNNAARKIQRQVRKKFIEPFMQLYKIIYSELKKDDETNKNAKSVMG